ncbi:MAG TPA: M20 family metallopeptidase [Thermoanaerobaculia bacterium]|jgi:acetylornithine deacetylase/succinyl-diaminopimelate desuccinylase|nr:M20 family metallopeptidase [Thermoanaerobaculia bacterium]
MIPSGLWEQVEARLVAAQPAELAAAMVRIPSHPGVARQEEAVARHLAAWLAAQGVAAELVEVAPGRPNVIVTAGSRDAGAPRLLLCGHTDTVPLNDGDPGHGFSGEVRDGRLLGRGAVDMKGPLAAMAAALVALDGALAEVGAATVLAAVVDEEMESLGAEALVRSRLRADAAVVGEPTGNRVALGHRGLEWLAIDFHGRAAHGGAPERGVNAIVAATRFVALAEERLVPSFASRRHPLLGPPTLNFGTIRGGDQPSTVAAACTLTLDRRSVPGESYAGIVAELTALLAEVERATPGLRTTLRRLEGGMATLEHVALETPADHPLARAAFAARGFVTGDAADAPVAFPAWTDGALLAAFAGIPTIVLGPGDLADAHSPRESIGVAELEEGARIYAALALEWAQAR